MHSLHIQSVTNDEIRVKPSNQIKNVRKADLNANK